VHKSAAWPVAVAIGMTRHEEWAKESGTRPCTIVAPWTAVAVLASLACVGGHALQDVAGNV
jgi:hypothetical protein